MLASLKPDSKLGCSIYKWYIIPYIKIIQIIFIATQSIMIGATGSCHMTGGKQIS